MVFGVLRWLKEKVVDSVAKKVEDATGIDIPFVGHTREELQRSKSNSTRPPTPEPSPKQQSDAAKRGTTVYYYATTDKSGETVVKEAKSQDDVINDKGKVVARGTEAEGKIAKMSGYAYGLLGRNPEPVKRKAKQRLKQAERKREEIESLRSDVDSDLKELEETRKTLERKRQRIEELEDRLQLYQPQTPEQYRRYKQVYDEYKSAVEEYNTLASKYNSKLAEVKQEIDLLNKNIREYNTISKEAYVLSNRAAGMEAGRKARQRMMHKVDPVQEQIRKLQEVGKKNPLAAIGALFATSVLTWRDPLGLRTIKEYVEGWWKGGKEEGIRRAMRVKGEALLELERTYKEGVEIAGRKISGPGALAVKGVTGPLSAMTVGTMAVGGAAGAVAGAATRVSPLAGKAITTAYATGGAYVGYKTVVEPIKEGRMGDAAVNAALMAMAYPMARYGWTKGWKAGYTRADQVVSSYQMHKATKARAAEYDAINDAIERVGIKPKPTLRQLGTDSIQRGASKSDFYGRIINMKKYDLEKIDTSKMVKAYETLRAQGKTAQARAVYDRIQAIENVKQMKGVGVPEVKTRSTPRGANYDAWRDQVLQSGREYYAGWRPYTTKLVEIQKPSRSISIRPTIKSPRDYAPQLSYFRQSRVVQTPAEQLGLDRISVGKIRVPMYMPTTHIIPIQTPATHIKSGPKPAQIQPVDVTPAEMIDYVPAVAHKEAELVSVGVRDIHIPISPPKTLTMEKTIETTPNSVSPPILDPIYEPPSQPQPPPPQNTQAFVPPVPNIPLWPIGRKSHSKRRKVGYAERKNPVATWEGVIEIAEGMMDMFDKPRRRRKK